MINIIVVTHGEFGAYLIEAAEEIVGVQDDGVRSISLSSRLPVEESRERLKRAVAELGGTGGIVIAVDMPGGSPCNLALPLAKDRADIRVVSGVNLYMLVTCFNSRRDGSLDSVADSMLAAGQRAVADIKAKFFRQREKV